MSRPLEATKHLALRTLLSAPAAVVRRLAGRPVEIDGAVLDAEMQFVLALERLEGPPVEALPVERGRRAMLAGARVVAGRLPIGSTTDRDIDGPGGALRLRIYTPRGVTATGPALVYLHGGGWSYGDLESHDGVCRFLAERAGVRVIAVDYRLAPEAPFPAAVEDAVAGYEWVAANAEGLGVDADRVAVGGDSSGGNLAAVVAQHTPPWGGVRPAFQLLIYPGTDFVERRPSRDAYAEGYYLSERYIDQVKQWYLGDFADPADPRLSPLRGALAGVAPAYVVTAGFDPLRDEGEAYADALREAGVDVEYVCERGLIHSFANMVAVGRSGPEAMGRAADALRRALRP